MLGPPGPKAIQSAVSASALIMSAPINARVLTTLRGSASSAPTKANVIPTGSAANSPAANLSALGPSSWTPSATTPRPIAHTAIPIAMRRPGRKRFLATPFPFPFAAFFTF